MSGPTRTPTHVAQCRPPLQEARFDSRIRSLDGDGKIDLITSENVYRNVGSGDAISFVVDSGWVPFGQVPNFGTVNLVQALALGCVRTRMGRQAAVYLTFDRAWCGAVTLIVMANSTCSSAKSQRQSFIATLAPASPSQARAPP